MDENGEYIYDENKIAGFNPAKNKKAETYPVPVKFWQCKDDPTVPFEVTERFVNKIRENGGIAYLRAFAHGGHEPQLVGAPVEKPLGKDVFDGQKLSIMPANEEEFIWIRSFD